MKTDTALKTTSIFYSAFLILLCGCVNDNRPADESENQKAQPQWLPLLENIADNILIPQYQRFEERTLSLIDPSGDLHIYCDGLGTEVEPLRLPRVQFLWSNVMEEWQKVEAMQVGPLIENDGALRNRIHSFDSSAPLNTCAVDQSVVLASSENFDLSTRSNNSKGLDALEYLLYSEDLTHTCPSQIIETQNWNARSELERKQLRCSYAKLVADDINNAASTLVKAWLPEFGNYRFRFLKPTNSAISEQLKSLSDALFYIESSAKDRKLGVPLGIHNNCSREACPETVESPLSLNSGRWVYANIRGFYRLFTGGSGLGFDDIIEQAGFPEVNEEILLAVTEIETQILTLNASSSIFTDATAIETTQSSAQCDDDVSHPDNPNVYDACALYGHLKTITDILRTDFITIVNVDLPQRSQSDND